GVDGPLLIDQPGLTDEAFTLSDLPLGVYSWRVQGARHRFGRLLEAWSEPQQLRIGRQGGARAFRAERRLETLVRRSPHRPPRPGRMGRRCGFIRPADQLAGADAGRRRARPPSL